MFLKFIFHLLVEGMFPSESVVTRISGTALPHSLKESSKPAASAVGGPLPHTPAVTAMVAGVGYLFVGQVADMSEAQAKRLAHH